VRQKKKKEWVTGGCLHCHGREDLFGRWCLGDAQSDCYALNKKNIGGKKILLPFLIIHRFEIQALYYAFRYTSDMYECTIISMCI
jgi:hypothetical protein